MFRGVVTSFISQLRLSFTKSAMQASSHNYKVIIFIPYCKISVIPIQSQMHQEINNLIT